MSHVGFDPDPIPEDEQPAPSPWGDAVHVDETGDPAGSGAHGAGGADPGERHHARGGDDLIFGHGGAGGDEILRGGAGDDTLVGGSGSDVMIGGKGADVFVFAMPDDGAGSAGDAQPRDVILDFGKHDLISFHALEIDAPSDGDQAFDFIGDQRFSGAGQAEISFHMKGKMTFVQVDFDGDGHRDMQIELAGRHHLDAGDFLL